MLFFAHAAVVSDSCTWAGAGREFLSGLPWPKVTGERGRSPTWRRGGDLGRVTKVDSSGGLSERPLGASHRPGTRQDQELKQEHIPSQSLGCFRSPGDVDAEERQDTAWSLRGGLVVQAAGLAQIKALKP